MSRTREPKGKIVRALGLNVFGNPKFDRLLDRKPHPPGKPPRYAPRKKSEYADQLRETRKYRTAYGLGRRQLKNLYEKARRAGGSTSAALLIFLEARLSNIVFRLGWAVSRAQARQLVGHGHVAVNGRTLDMPSAVLRPGDVLELRAPESLTRDARGRAAPLPSWLAREDGGLAARMTSAPAPEEASVPGRIGRVVEFFAR
jgi:small subunit ribosomal protein S4